MAYRVIVPAVLLGLLCFAAADGILSLDSSSGFQSLRECAYGCYNGGIRDGYEVTNKLGCMKPGIVYVPPDNDCFCRPDLQVTAVRYLSACAYTSCNQNQLDISSATQVYKEYCASAGYIAAAPNSVSAQATSDIVSTTRSSSGLVTNNATPTLSQPTGGPTSSPLVGDSTSGLGIGAIVGICAGVISALAAVIGCIIKYMQYKKQKQQAQQRQAHERYAQGYWKTESRH